MHNRPPMTRRTVTPPRSSATLVGWLVLACVCGGASVAWAQAAFPLSALIDPDVALYVEIAQPDQQWDTWERSELARRWKQSGLEALFDKSDFVRQWRKVDEVVSHATPLTLTDHLRGLCGKGLSLAVYVPSQGAPQGLWVSRARSSAALEATLKAWDTLEPLAKTERRGTPREEYFARRIRKGAQEQVLFYVRHDNVLVLSDQESLVSSCARRLSALLHPADTTTTIAAARPVFQEVELVVPDHASAAVWMYGNPRAWDRVLDKEFDHSPGAELARNVWRSLRGLGLSLRMNDGLTLTLRAQLDPRQSHPGWLAATQPTDSADPLQLPERLSIWEHAPADAVLVAGGSLRPAWWLQRIHALQNDREQDDWRRLQRVLRGALGGVDPWADVGTALMRDWGLVIAPRSGSSPSLRPGDWSVASVHQMTAEVDQRPELAGAVDDGLGLGMQLLAAQLNSDGDGAAVTPMRIREAGIVGRTMTGRAGVDFGYQLAANRLLIGWPLALMQQRLAANSAAHAELVDLSTREFPRPSLMAWINLEMVRGAIRRDPEHPRLKDDPPVPVRAAELFDRGFGAISLASDHLEFKLGGRYGSTR